jgi:hypothetical protein
MVGQRLVRSKMIPSKHSLKVKCRIVNEPRALLKVLGNPAYASADLRANRIRSFRQGLTEAGITEGRDATIEYRLVVYQTKRLPRLARELVSRGINVLAAPGSTAAALAGKASTSTVPISLSRRQRSDTTWAGRQP